VATDDKGTVFNQDVLSALELGFMLDNAEATVIGALERRESRGAQYRTDFPERNDDDWLRHITVTHGADGDVPELAYSEVTLTQWQPEARTY
jgi:succinate dehydrogenase / fumarate reductase flavoprotein subunit